MDGVAGYTSALFKAIVWPDSDEEAEGEQKKLRSFEEVAAEMSLSCTCSESHCASESDQFGR